MQLLTQVVHNQCKHQEHQLQLPKVELMVSLNNTQAIVKTCKVNHMGLNKHLLIVKAHQQSDSTQVTANKQQAKLLKALNKQPLIDNLQVRQNNTQVIVNQ